MKYKVTTPYVDRNTLEERAAGDVVELTPGRAKELKGYVKKMRSRKTAKSADEKDD